ncbi:phospholipase A [Nemorincola caseinilytica]|uniref:phospholipase A n=1 Tax=Nemorincola caseinilytica TaxID=2054315 RepID=UPI0031F01D51
MKKRFFDSLVGRMPSFSIYNDNYFVLGAETDKKITSATSNAKFQISFKQRLFSGKLPLNSMLFMTYTQKSFWNIFEKSNPFAESNYNPTIAFGVPTFSKKTSNLTGLLVFAIEHESNGRDSIFSRSWNRVAASFRTKLNDDLNVDIKVWIPFMYEDNPQLFHYIGYAELAFHYSIINDRLSMDLNCRKGDKGWNGNLQSAISYRISKKSNQFLFLQWFYGNAESLLYYNSTTSVLRAGVNLRPLNVFF